MTYKHTLCWIRRDLRLKDHTALAAATQQSASVTLVFIFDVTLLKNLKDKDDKRLSFIHQSLVEVDRNLRSKRSALVVRYGDPGTEIPKLARALKAEAVFTNRDYEPSAKKRDKKVQEALRAGGIDFKDFKDQVIFEGLEVKTGSGEPYRVFTPYKNSWLSALNASDLSDRKPNLQRLTPLARLKPHLKPWDLKKVGFQQSDLWLEPGEAAARKQLRRFEATINQYDQKRNFPSDKRGTSGLSVHLRFGTLSIRELVRFAKRFRTSGSRTWLSELIWRDFYHMILDQFPHVAHGCFKKDYDRIAWPGKEAHFKAWKDGQTGFPLVDAAMRHFKQTGWMHNRLRMIVASFLTKDLLVSWRKGEAWFAQKLLDFDLAANNGGWQWSASTGCDAQPYFRIFNPVAQSEKFDPDGTFIRHHVPELKDLPKEKIHWPHEDGLGRGRIKYAKPLVDHSRQRIKAIQLFKKRA